MEATAKPQDILLAYNDDFVGYETANTMAQPLEPVPGPTATGVFGGTSGPDGYFEDFTARLDHFVRAHPRLGGDGQARKGLDWDALVITFAEPPDSDGEDEEGAEDTGGEDVYPPEDVEPPGGGDERPGLMSLSDFIVEADGGKRAGRDALEPPAQRRDDNLAPYALPDGNPDFDDFVFVGGEMDETDVETPTYDVFKTLPLEVNRPDPSSILAFSVEK